MQNTFSLTINNISPEQIERVTRALEPATVAQQAAIPTIPQPAVSTQTFKTEYEAVLEVLGDPRYEQRSLAAFNSAMRDNGYLAFDTEWSLKNFLDRHQVAYFTKTRRRDGATLFGLHKAPQGAEQGVVPEPGAVVQTTARSYGKHDKLMELLNDPRYTYRTAKTLKEKVGFVDNNELFNYLSDNDIEYETYVNDNGDILVALSSRT